MTELTLFRLRLILGLRRAPSHPTQDLSLTGGRAHRSTRYPHLARSHTSPSEQEQYGD